MTCANNHDIIQFDIGYCQLCDAIERIRQLEGRNDNQKQRDLRYMAAHLYADEYATQAGIEEASRAAVGKAEAIISEVERQFCDNGHDPVWWLKSKPETCPICACYEAIRRIVSIAVAAEKKESK